MRQKSRFAACEKIKFIFSILNRSESVSIIFDYHILPATCFVGSGKMTNERVRQTQYVARRDLGGSSRNEHEDIWCIGHQPNSIRNYTQNAFQPTYCAYKFKLIKLCYLLILRLWFFGSSTITECSHQQHQYSIRHLIFTRLIEIIPNVWVWTEHNENRSNRECRRICAAPHTHPKHTDCMKQLDTFCDERMNNRGKKRMFVDA